MSVIIQALIVAGVTAVVTAFATGFVNGKIMESKLKDLTDRIVRIEEYLNGLLKSKRGDR
jgi:hypothetical protein